LTRIISVIPLPVFLVALPVRYAASAEQVEIIELTNPEDIRHASTLDRSIDSLSNKVTECVQRKLAPASECFCLYPQDLARVRNTYEGALRQHPDWNNKTVSYTLEGRTHAISLGGLSRQFQTQCPQGD
jgi:hypothetical protein